MNAPYRFVERPFPSANALVIGGDRPIVVDAGFASDADATATLVRELGCGDAPFVLNTHHHSDHVGANGLLQEHFGARIATHAWEADLVNTRDPDANVAHWLDQPVPAYHVDDALTEGDVVETGFVSLRVLHVPGHTLGHIALYDETNAALVSGDVAYPGDVGWVNVVKEGIGGLDRAIRSIDRLDALGAATLYPGHGPVVHGADAVRAIFADARRRYATFRAQPQKMTWHACKRIFGFALMIRGGFANMEEAARYVATSPWGADYARITFDRTPESFGDELVAEMLRSRGAVRNADGRLVAGMTHGHIPETFHALRTGPRDWPERALV
jgi:glyoxylase-like metal-dependent hydrolase (beta-lactamase superfamily II)